jgi:hypothetical protein
LLRRFVLLRRALPRDLLLRPHLLWGWPLLRFHGKQAERSKRC